MAERPLRLLVVGASWPPQTFLGRLMRGLSAAGVEVTVAFSRAPDQDWFFNAGLRAFRTRDWSGPVLLRVVRFTWLFLRALLKSPRDLRLFLRRSRADRGLRARLRTLNRLLPFAGVSCDVLYFPWNSAAIDHLPLFDLGIPVLVSCRGSQVNVAPYDPKRGVARGLPATFEKATAVHCISGAIEREAQRFRLDPTKARVIHPGIDPEFFVPPETREPSPVLRLVEVGSLVWVKGATYALQAVRKLLDRGIPVALSLVGEGPARQRILYTIDDLDLWDHVTLLGALSPVAVRDRLQQSDIFVLPSLSEGFCNAAVEAMACGLPVVMTNCGGVREGVTDGVEGFIVPVRDPDAMAAAIEKLAKDAALRERMARAGRARVLRQFTLTSHVHDFVTLLEKVRDCRIA
ncbi:MAG TPA: glycosyltransferase family 4 protein [Thermoanaerobaculia bacterium]|jgi:colanic acid/amylovoran biosynthesis glycosyltransferase|nr:glycosyltransferase family 4 protein [Thermoanaerobaculia bacterium]